MYYVYILKSKKIEKKLYIGFTNDLRRRLQEHREGLACLHTKRIPMKKLAWHENYPDRFSAAKREREIKGWRRAKKESLWSVGSSLS